MTDEERNHTRKAQDGTKQTPTQTNVSIMPPRLVRVGGYIRNGTGNACRQSHLTAFSLHREDVRRHQPLPSPLDRNLKFNSSEKRRRPSDEKKVPDDEWELRVGKPFFLDPLHLIRTA